MESPLSIILKILENPSSKKVYKDLKNYYNRLNLTEESDSINFLIENKFHETRDPNLNQE